MIPIIEIVSTLCILIGMIYNDIGYTESIKCWYNHLLFADCIDKNGNSGLPALLEDGGF